MINWLIEEFSRDNSFLEIRDAAIARGHTVKVVESTPFFYDPHWSLFPKGSPVVFLGSIQCGKQVQRAYHHHQWDLGLWCTWDNYCCTTYYAHWGEYTFNQDYYLMPLADFNRKRCAADTLISRACLTSLFVRPDTGDKPFTGQVFTDEEFKGKLWEISTEGMKSSDLLLISSPKMIEREWRVVCSRERVITGSRYKTAGMVDYRRELPDDVRLFTEKVIATDYWQPDPIYVVDICRDRNGKLWLLEIGAFNVAGLYHCDFNLIVEAVEGLVKEREDISC